MTRPPKNGTTENPLVDLFLRISLQMTAPLRKWPNVTIDAALAMLSRWGSRSKAICSILSFGGVNSIRSGDGVRLKCEIDITFSIESAQYSDNGYQRLFAEKMCKIRHYRGDEDYVVNRYNSSQQPLHHLFRIGVSCVWQCRATTLNCKFRQPNNSQQMLILTWRRLIRVRTWIDTTLENETENWERIGQ